MSWPKKASILAVVMSGAIWGCDDTPSGVGGFGHASNAVSISSSGITTAVTTTVTGSVTSSSIVSSSSGLAASNAAVAASSGSLSGGFASWPFDTNGANVDDGGTPASNAPTMPRTEAVAMKSSALADARDSSPN